MARFQEIDLCDRFFVVAVMVAGFMLCFPFAAQANELIITSDQLEMDENKEIAIFIGGVVAREGEMALFADKMVVHYYKKGGDTGRGGVHKVMAVGHVIIEQAENKGRANSAEYVVDDRKLILIGKGESASILHGGDQLSGERILLILGEDRKIDNVSVLGVGKQRVSARITPSSLRRKNKKTPSIIVNSAPPPKSTSGMSQRLPRPKRRSVGLDSSFAGPIQPPLIAPKRRLQW